MRERILMFLDAIDAWLIAQAKIGQQLDLYVIGKAAVILFYGGDQAGAMTSDVDVVQISHPPPPLLAAEFVKFHVPELSPFMLDNFFRVDTLNKPNSAFRQRKPQDPTDRCICWDADYVKAYRRKYSFLGQ